MGFKVMEKACETCIYRKDSPLDLKKLEGQVKDKYIGFKSHRICHNHTEACCRGFWNKHKNEFPAGQVAQRLNVVEFVKYQMSNPDFTEFRHQYRIVRHKQVFAVWVDCTESWYQQMKKSPRAEVRRWVLESEAVALKGTLK